MSQSKKNERASAVIAECMLRQDAGEVVDREQVLADYPDLADELREYFNADARLGIALGSGPAPDDHAAGDDRPEAKRETARPTGDSVPAGADSFDRLPVEFGRYRVTKVLGQGAMGAVYLAHDTKLARDVALKTPKLDAFADTEMVERFEREARAAAGLNHRNVCPVYDVGEIDGVRFLTMAYIEGKPLSAFVSEVKPMSRKQAAIVVRKLAQGLQAAHDQGVIHRDLKPANVMVDKSREPVVMDFGLAHRSENTDRSRLTGVGVLMGSPAYMSPEQVSGDPSAVGAATDIYSLGVLLYELLTGKLPYEGSVVAIIGQIVSADPPNPTSVRPDVDSELSLICRKMMAKSTDDRYASMQEVADSLAAYLRTIRKSNSGHTGRQSMIASDLVSEEISINVSPLPEKRPGVRSPGRRSGGKATAWKRWTAAGLTGVLVVALGVIFFRTPYGTIRIETAGDLEGLEVFVDGNVISLSQPEDTKATEHELELRLHGVHLRLDPGAKEFVMTRDGEEHRLSVSVGDVRLSSKAFTVTKNNETVLKIELIPPSLMAAADSSTQRHGSGQGEVVSDAGNWTGLPERWTWEDGVLVGTGDTKLANNTVFCSDRPYTDFELNCDVKLEAVGNGRGPGNKPNSGIQFRSTIVDRATFSVTGPQADIGQNCWGDLYGEGTTGLMYGADRQLVDSTVRVGDWNQYRLRVEGDRVSIRINDIEVVNRVFPGLPESGVVGFQLHRRTGMSVRFRHIVIRDLTQSTPPNRIPAREGWTTLFNRRDLTGWQLHSKAEWAVRNGVLTGTGTNWIMTEAEFQDFELELEYRLPRGGNSGVFLRAWPEGKGSGSEFHEVQLLDDTAAKYSDIPDFQRNGSLWNALAASPVLRPAPDEWHRMRIVLTGDQLRVSVNGQQVVNGRLPAGKGGRGRIGFQAHQSRVEFRDIRVRRLRPVASASTGFSVGQLYTGIKTHRMGNPGPGPFAIRINEVDESRFSGVAYFDAPREEYPLEGELIGDAVTAKVRGISDKLDWDLTGTLANGDLHLHFGGSARQGVGVRGQLKLKLTSNDFGVTIQTQGDASQLAVSPDGVHVAATGADSPGRITIYDTRTGSRIARFDDPERPGLPTRGLTWSPDGHSLLYCTGPQVRVLSATTGNEQATYEFAGSPRLVVFPKRALALALYYEEDHVHRRDRARTPLWMRIWDWKNNRVLHDEVSPLPRNFPAISPDERFVTLAEQHRHVRFALDITDEKVVLDTRTDFEPTSRVRGSLEFSPDGQYAATSLKSNDGIAAIVDLLTGRIVTLIDPETAQATGADYGCRLSFTLDGKHIAVADHTGRCALWDASDGSLVAELEQFQKTEKGHATPAVVVSSLGDVILGGGSADRRITIKHLKQVGRATQ